MSSDLDEQMPQWTSELHGTSDSLPTVSQWMKTVSTECCEATRIVKLIWCPNMYESYSLDTEAYRIRIGKGHPLFEVLEDNLDEWIQAGTVIASQVVKGRKATVILLTLDNETCEWDALGEHGWKSGQVIAKVKNVPAKTSKQKSPPAEQVHLTPLQGASE